MFVTLSTGVLAHQSKEAEDFRPETAKLLAFMAPTATAFPTASTLLASCAWDSDRRRRNFMSFRYTATLSTSVAGRNPPDWWDQSDA